MSKAVAYYRVSTDKQGRSGLGMEAQQTAVEALCRVRGWELIAPPFQEVESGKRDDRPELLKAIERCRQTGATLVVAKLDRLSRNVAFLATLQDSGIKFVAADMPEANELTVHIMAAVAQAERKMISQRTKDALAAVKARGTRLGNPNGVASFKGMPGSAAGVAASKLKADEHAWLLWPVIERLKAEGHTSLGSLSKQLNEEGMRTPRGGKWHASSVRNLLSRIQTGGSPQQHPDG
jgi:DNA invertase Pin-like site-specific DNA recombinase